MERDCESELSKLNIEQNACIYHFGASVIHGQRSNILRLHDKKIQTVTKNCLLHPIILYFREKNEIHLTPLCLTC